MPRPWNPHNADDLIQRYLAGESEKTLALETDVSRTAFRGMLERRGVQRRDRSAAMFSRMARTPPDERQRLASAAHAATRGRPRTESAKIKTALSRQESGTYIGRWEQEVFDALLDRGIHGIPQLAVRGYNIDIAVWPLAVEVHSMTSYPHLSSPTHYQRIKHLFDRGWGSVYVMSRNTVRVDAVADQLIALLEAAERDPASIREYRVIRGTGELTSFTIDDFNQFAREPSPVAASDS